MPAWTRQAWTWQEVVSAQRIDKWLWFARVAKTRSLAARLVEAGHVRVDGLRATNPAKALRGGQVLTIALERQVRVLRVVAEGERRGPYKEACALFEEITERDTGAGDTATDGPAPPPCHAEAKGLGSGS